MGSLITNDLTAGENTVRLGGIRLIPDLAEQDNGPNATPADAGKTEANIVRLMTPAECRVHARGMQSEHLAEYVVKNGWGDVLVGLKQLKPYLEILWGRFDELKGTETIAGCRTKAEFCNKRLHRSIRAVQYMLYGRSPEKADSARSGQQPKAGQDEVVLDADSDATLPAEAADGVTLEEPTVLRLAHGPNPAANGAAQSREESRRPGHDEEEEKEVVGNVMDAPVPQPAGDPVPDPDPGVMEALRQRVNLMADTHEIAEALQEFFSGLSQPLLEQHQYGPSSTICVKVSRRDCSRIAEGDWVEYKGGDTRLTERAGRDKALGRVVGMDTMSRPRIRWHNGQAWGKPYSLYHNYHASSLRVLFAFQAAQQFPEAYGSYPAEGEGAAAPSPEAKQGMSKEASRTLSKAAPEPPIDGAGAATTDAARKGEMAKHEYPSSDLETIMKWTQTNCGTAKDIVAQCPDLAEKRVKKVREMCEQLVAEGRLTATDVPPLRYIGQAGAYFRELRKKGVY